MDTFDRPTILPTSPRAGARGRKDVSPVWWLWDDSSFAATGLDERPDNELLIQDETMEKILQSEIPMKALPDLLTNTAKAEHRPMSFANRLRRQRAATYLSSQYLESDKCSTRESHEAGAVAKQTIRSTVATQDDTNWTNNRAARRCQLPAHMNQPGLVKISSGSRRASAQTAAATLETGVCEDTVDCAGQQNDHKANVAAGSSPEDTCTRPSIASAETASIKAAGRVFASVGRVQYFEAATLSPQHAEFLNVHSSGVRHESLLLPSRRDLSTPHNRTEGKANSGCIKSLLAKFDSRVKARVKEKRQTRQKAAMRAETAARQASSGHDARFAKIPSSHYWDEQLGPKESAPRDVDNMLSPRGLITSHLLRGLGAGGGQLFEQLPISVLGSPESLPSTGDFEFGLARPVRYSKPGKASMIEVCPQRSPSFDISSMSTAEADLMASAGAMAKSSRRASAWSDGAQSCKSSTSAIDAAAESVSSTGVHQQFQSPCTAPGVTAQTARPSEQKVGNDSDASGQDVRFRQLVRRLETDDPKSKRDTSHSPVHGISRMPLPREAAYKQRTVVSIDNERFARGRKQISSLEHKLGYLSLNDPRQRRTPINEGPTLTLPAKTPANPNRHLGDSGCPSLISDDGQESTDLAEDTADDHARAPLSHGRQGVSAWGKDEHASTAPSEASSEGSFTLINIGTDDNELPSRSDTNEDDADENATSCSGRGWWYREPRALASPLSFRHGNRPSRLRERHRGHGRTAGRQPNELSLYAQCAILRWLICTTDAPGTPGMWHESSEWWELLEPTEDYQQRYGDDVRAEMLRVLLFLSDPEEPLPEPSQEVQAFIREMNPAAVPQGP